MDYDDPVAQFMPLILFSPLEDENYSAEHLWSTISQSFLEARDSKNSFESRKEDALIFYALLSHDMTLDRRQSTLTRIALAYLEEVIGFDMPFTKEKYDINTEAVTRDVRTFIDDCRKGEFFDTEVTSQEILEWHSTHAAEQRKLRNTKPSALL
jgi:hypothetical protein